MHYLLCSRSLSSLQHLLSFRCLFHYGSSLPGVKTLVCLCVLFLSFSLCFLLILCWMFTWILSSFSLPLPHCLGQVLFAAELVSPSISIFLPLVRPFLSSFSLSLPLCVCSSDRQASKRLTTPKHTRQPQLYGPHTPHTPVAAPLKPPLSSVNRD